MVANERKSDRHADALEMSSNRGRTNLDDEDRALLLLQTPKTIQTVLPEISSRADLVNSRIGTRVFALLRFKSNCNARLESSKTNAKVQWVRAVAYLAHSLSDNVAVKLEITSFHNSDDLYDRITDCIGRRKTLAVNGSVCSIDGKLALSDVRTHPNNNNEPCGIYAPHNGIPKLFMGEVIAESLQNKKWCRRAVKLLYEQLGISTDAQFDEVCQRFGIAFPTALDLILAVHSTSDVQRTIQAKEDMEVLATSVFVERIVAEKTHQYPIDPISLDLDALKQAVLAFSFLPTREQRRIAIDILQHFETPLTSSHLIYGDVGYGKTAVLSMIVHQLLFNEKSIIVLSPAEHLAIQTYNVFCSTFPTLRDRFKLVTSNTDEMVCEQAGVCYVGTSAVIHRDSTKEQFIPYAMIVDEEQRLGVAQRDFYRSRGAHYIAASATPIPRTIAGTLLGHYHTHTLTKCFVEKEFIGKLYMEDVGRRLMFDDIRASISQGRQTLIICPLTTESDADGFEDLVSVEDLFMRMQQQFGDVWRLVHSKRDSDDNSAALSAMRDGTALGLVASTAVEVGIDLPDLKDIYVLHPERFGLTQLHQLRGRIVRQGGVGFIRLFSPKLLTADQVARLEYFLSESNGAKVAEYDAQRRGVGELLADGHRQSGRSKQATFIRHLVVSYNALKLLHDRIERV